MRSSTKYRTRCCMRGTVTVQSAGVFLVHPFSAFGGISKADFRLLKGAESIKHYAKNANTILGFCSVCGSSLYAAKTQREMINLRLGTLRDTPSLAPQAHAFVGSKVPWYEIRDDLVQFEGAPSPSQWPSPSSRA